MADRPRDELNIDEVATITVALGDGELVTLTRTPDDIETVVGDLGPAASRRLIERLLAAWRRLGDDPWTPAGGGPEPPSC